MYKNRSLLTKQSRASLLRVFAVVLIGSVVLFSLPLPRVQAGTLTTPRDYLSTQKANTSTGVQHEVFFTAANAVNGGAGVNKVILQFPDADDTKWCRTVGTGDLTVTGIANPTGGSETATSLPGTLTGACTQGSGASSYDKITVSGVNNLSATKYGVRIAQNTSTVLGTAASAGNDIQVTVTTNNGTSDVDSGTLATSLISDDQIAVSATVTPTLTVSLSGNTAALGTLSTSNVNQAGITSTVTTNAASGYASVVKYGATLTSGSDTVADTSGGTIVAGTEEFGASSSQSGNTIAQWSPTSCATTATTSNATALSTSYQSFASASAPVSSQAATLCFLASIAVTTEPGSYTSTATLVTTAKF